MRRREAGYTVFPDLPIRGWAGRLLGKLRPSGRAQPQLRLVERIALAPRQSLALVEAQGRRFLVATSTDGAPAFYPLEGSGVRPGGSRFSGAAGAARATAARVSW